MLQVLTPTGARPEAFRFCQRWAAAQDYAAEIHWIIVDDGPVPLVVQEMPSNWDVTVLRPKPFWEIGQNTQCRNMLKGLQLVNDKFPLVIWEDDDYYAKDWLTTVSQYLKDFDLVGETRARYYNLTLKSGREFDNMRHASLCSTGLKGPLVAVLERICSKNVKFVDMKLWTYAAQKMLFPSHRVVGIKGLPGRTGIGVGHSPRFNGVADPTGKLLRSWLGDDASAYLPYTAGQAKV